MRLIRWSLPFALLGALILPASLFANASTPVHLTYETYVLGFPTASLSSTLDLGPPGYRIDVAVRTIGAAAIFFGGYQTSEVRGLWEADRPEPSWFMSDGVWHGENRHVLIEYPHGQPSVLSLVPPEDPDREPVPAAMGAQSVDQLSAMALLIHRVAETGRCDASARTYDGRRLAVVEAATVGEERLPFTGRSSFSGPALRCNFEGRLLAGFVRGADAAARRGQHMGLLGLRRSSPERRRCR